MKTLRVSITGCVAFTVAGIVLQLSVRAQNVKYVPPPGAVTKTYLFSGVTFGYPNNWEIGHSTPTSVTLSAPGGQSSRNGRGEVTHGLSVGFYQSTQAGGLRPASQLLN